MSEQRRVPSAPQTKLRCGHSFARLVLCGIGIALLMLSLPACGGESEHKAAVTVTTTLELYADVVRSIGGDRVSVRSILPAAADPHTFEPSPRDVARAAGSDAVVANGFGLEESVLKVLRPALPADVPLIELAECAIERGTEPIGENPHLWLDVDVMKVYAAIIRDELVRVDPDGQETYDADYELYASELEKLGTYMKQTAGVVPEQHRKLVSTHDAFPYMARYLGLEVAAVVAPSPGQEASPAAVAELTRTIRDLSIPAVFAEPQLGSERKVLEQAAADAGAKVCTLYSATLDQRVRTYIDLMTFNADEIARCLGGDR